MRPFLWIGNAKAGTFVFIHVHDQGAMKEALGQNTDAVGSETVGVFNHTWGDRQKALAVFFGDHGGVLDPQLDAFSWHAAAPQFDDMSGFAGLAGVFENIDQNAAEQGGDAGKGEVFRCLIDFDVEAFHAAFHIKILCQSFQFASGSQMGDFP